jgi:aspartate 1-decarboxylase
MNITICTSKIHRATVTEADLNYVGSITIDQDLMDAAHIKPYQILQITNCSNGALWRTYAIAGDRGKGDICLNGPPARIFQPGDKVIILAEAWVEPEEMERIEPVVVFVDDKNKITEVKKHKLIEPFTNG